MPPEPADARVHVASINTAAATELCIRTLRQYAGHPFELVVGDCGSTDGSLPMLRDLEARGWLRLEVAPGGRKHAEWLDRWLHDCPRRYAVFCDSDIEFLAAGWLDDMVQTARATGAALVGTEMLPERRRFVHPVSGAQRTLGQRPAPWLLLCDTHLLEGRVDASFGYREFTDDGAFGGKLAYDVAGAYFLAVREAGLGWAQMPDAFRSKFRHFNGLSWRKVLDRSRRLRLRPGQVRRILTVHARVRRARRLDLGARTA